MNELLHIKIISQDESNQLDIEESLLCFDTLETVQLEDNMQAQLVTLSLLSNININIQSVFVFDFFLWALF